jgi:hypothetical protein
MGAVTPAPLSLGTLVGLARGRTPRREPVARLRVPAGMTAPLGCDTVSLPAVHGQRVLDRLPQVGCVYGDGSFWWWLVPSDSDVALRWPAPARYTPGTLVPDTCRPPALLHRPEGSIPYTPPIPLYLALCRVTGTSPAWSGTLPA